MTYNFNQTLSTRQVREQLRQTGSTLTQSGVLMLLRRMSKDQLLTFRRAGNQLVWSPGGDAVQ